MNPKPILCTLLGLVLLSSLDASGQTEKEVLTRTLFQIGQGNYNGYRIPSLITTQKGTLLAFAEGREAGDSGDIDLLVKRSEDDGLTWTEAMLVWDDGDNTCGNPCPVIDEQTGRIWLFMTWNIGADHESQIIQGSSHSPRIPYLCYSDDDGLTWSIPENMAASCRDSTWGWYATGPGIGIHLKNGPHKGRLIIPANHSYPLVGGSRYEAFEYGAHVLFSDDHGQSWQYSSPIGPKCNESQVTELSDGTLIMNMRSYHGKHARALSYSKDGGNTWSEVSHDFQLVESVCQASLLNFGPYKGNNLHLFLNPAVPVGRSHLTLKASFDDCVNWNTDKLLYPGKAAYSSMARLANGKIGIFFEHGSQTPYEKMTFMAFEVEEIFNPDFPDY